MKTSATFRFSLFTFHCDERNAARGFTLIELLMVIAILGIVSTLAVSKIGGIREVSARKVSVANQIAVERTVGSYLTNGGRLTRLDSLVYTQGDITAPWEKDGSESGGYGFACAKTNYDAKVESGLYLGPVEDGSDGQAVQVRGDWNAGVTPGLRSILCPYSLTDAQRMALGQRLGLNHVMGHNVYAGDPASSGSPYADKPCGDGSYVESRNGRNPNESGCVAIAVTNTSSRMTLFAVNPVVEAGRAVYRSCGAELLKTRKNGELYDEKQAVAEVNAAGGPLLALGLGPSASVVGKADAGLESAPFATYPSRIYYANYILLIRLRTVGATVIPEFAGVIDPCGHTIRAAREIIRNL